MDVKVCLVLCKDGAARRESEDVCDSSGEWSTYGGTNVVGYTISKVFLTVIRITEIVWSRIFFCVSAYVSDDT